MIGPRNDDQRIGDFWNALTRGNQADAASLDPSTTELILRLDTLSQTPPPGSARERARQRVFEATPLPKENTMTAITVPSAYPSPNGHGTQPRPAPRTYPTRARPKWAWAALAAALLLVLGGLGSYFSQDGNRPFFGGATGTEQPNVIPAATVESGWPQFRGGAARTGYSSDPGPAGDLDLRWTFTTDEVVNSVISANGTVYAYGRKGDLYAIDAVTGAQRWAVDLSSGEYSEENRYPSPAEMDGVLYTATFDGAVVALDAQTGDVIWQRTIANQRLTSSTTAAVGALYQLSLDGAMLALDPATGDTLWESSGSVAFQDLAPAVGDGQLFIGDLDGALVAIDATTGETVWISEPMLVHRVAAYRDGVVYVSCDDGSFKALDANSGEILWTTDPQDGQALNPLVTPNAFIATNQEGPLQALDLTTGVPIWSVPGPGNSSSPHASQSAVYAVSADLSAFVAYDLETGEELGRVAVDQAGSTAAISGDTLVLSSIADQGVVRSFGPGSGAPIEVTAGPSVAIPAATPLASDLATPAAATASSFDPSQTSFVWQATGSASDPLQGAAGLGIGSDGTIYVTDDVRSVIDLFSSDGTYMETWGEPGSGPGQFASPGSIGFDADGNIYVFDTLNNRVQKFASDRTFLLEWGTAGTGNGEFSEVHGAVDAVAERVYVAEFLNDRVQVFDLDGNFIDKWGSTGLEDGQFSHPNGVSIDADGNVYVGESVNGTGARLQKFDPFGRWLETIGSSDGVPAQFTEVWGSAMDAQGNLYVSDYWNNRIQVFTPDLTPIGVIEDVPGAGPFLHPVRLLITDDGILYVTDYDNGRLLKLKLPPQE